ncbi:MAG: YbjN domain-containing protein [Woeseiaceae bacterium]
MGKLSTPFFAITLVLSFVLCGSATAETLRKDYDNDEIIEILRADGYSAVKEVNGDEGQRTIEIKVNGSTYALRIFDDGDLLLYFGMTGFSLTADDINRWNQVHRLTRAYLDSDNDPILEADLLANAGYSPAQMTEFLKVFVQQTVDYMQYLRDVDQSESFDGGDDSPTLSL